MKLFQYTIYFNDDAKPFAHLAYQHKWIDGQLQLFMDDGRLIVWYSAHRIKHIDISEWEDETGVGPVITRIEDRVLLATV